MANEQEKKTESEKLDEQQDISSIHMTGGIPVATQIISSATAEALAKQSPEKLLQFVESYDERQFKFYSQKEENHYKHRLAQENTKRMGMGLVFATISAVMVYSGVTGDKDLSEKIINVTIGALGGLGAGAVFLRQKNGD